MSERIGWDVVAAVTVLGYVSLRMMGILQATEISDFRIENLRDMQMLWYALGAGAFLAALLLTRYFPRFAVIVATLKWMFLLGLCYGMGERVHGLPYLHLYGFWINMLEAWCLVMLFSAAGLLDSKIRFEYQLMIGALPFIAAWLVGSLNGATCYGIAFAMMISRRSFWSGVGIAVLSIIPAVISMAAEFPPISSPSAMKYNQFLLYDIKAGANAHTELILSHVDRSMGPGYFVTVWIALLFLVLRLFARRTDLAVGLATFLTVQASLAGLVSFGLLRNPASGVTFPFLSYSGSLLIVELALLGAAVGWRKNLSR